MVEMATLKLAPSELSVKTQAALARDFSKNPLSSEERADVLDTLGAALLALGYTLEQLPAMYDYILTKVDTPQLGFEKSQAEMMKRRMERDIEAIRAERLRR
jgi:hypothetical protein